MFYVQANIGRNAHHAVELDETTWQGFIGKVRNVLLEIESDTIKPGADTHRVEVHYGWGEYNGQGEASAHVSLLIDRRLDGDVMAHAMVKARRSLAQLAYDYGQEAIALITGSRLIKPA